MRLYDRALCRAGGEGRRPPPAAGENSRTEAIITPSGIRVEVDICALFQDGRSAACGVYKDAGDDIDVTDGALICARVSDSSEPGIRIDGGEGVGRVTRKGLEQPVGAAAINRVPRQMIEAEVRQVCRQAGYGGGLSVTVWVPCAGNWRKKPSIPIWGSKGNFDFGNQRHCGAQKACRRCGSPSGWKSGSWPQTEPNSCF